MQVCGVNVSMVHSNEILPEIFQRRRKQFVDVVATHKLDDFACPQTIILANGKQYNIDKYHDPRPARIEGTGMPVMIYEIWMKGKQTVLFEAGGCWWVLTITH